MKAYELGDIDNSLYPYHEVNRIDGGVYLVHKDPLFIDLEPIHSFCFQKRVYTVINATMFDSDGQETFLASE